MLFFEISYRVEEIQLLCIYISNMGNFNGKKKFGGGRKFLSNNRGGDERDSGGPTMHKATCHECGKDCEVPFRPTGSRPIFCSICFDKQGGSAAKFGDRNGERSGGDRNTERSFDRPRFGGDKRKHEFEKENAVLENKMADYQKSQFAQLNAKLDRLTQIVDTFFASKAAEVMKETDEAEPVEKAPFKMKTKVSPVKKAVKKVSKKKA